MTRFRSFPLTRFGGVLQPSQILAACAAPCELAPARGGAPGPIPREDERSLKSVADLIRDYPTKHGDLSQMAANGQRPDKPRGSLDCRRLAFDGRAAETGSRILDVPDGSRASLHAQLRQVLPSIADIVGTDRSATGNGDADFRSCDQADVDVTARDKATTSATVYLQPSRLS